MNILRIIGQLFLLYLLYKLIFDFIIPVYRTSRRIKKQFGEMQEKMHQQMNRSDQPQSAKQGEPVAKEDYIEYEDIK